MKINEQFLLVIGAIIILIAGFFIYISLSDKKQVKPAELNSTIKIEDIIKENSAWVKENQERTKASNLLPKDVFLRDIQQIPGTDGLYLGLYIDKFTINITETDESVPYMICPEQNYGAVSITGDYYIFVMNNDKLIDKLLIPQSNSESEFGSTSTSITLTLKNTKINNFYLYNEPEPTEKESGDITRVNLIKFNDYTNDGKFHEFNLLGYYLSCGHNEYLIAGYDSKNIKAIIYPIINNGEKYYWGDNFIPNGNTIDYELKCGDHGIETNINKVFQYDDKLSGYKLISKSEKACAYGYQEVVAETTTPQIVEEAFEEPKEKPKEITYEYISRTKFSDNYVGKIINWKGVFSNQTCLNGPKLWPYDEKFLNGERRQYEWFWVIPREIEELMIDPNFDGKWCNYVLNKYGGLSEDQIDAEKDIYLVTGKFTGNDCKYYDLSVFNRKICIPQIDVISIKKVGSRTDSIIPK